jgi:hypothetical protein
VRRFGVGSSFFGGEEASVMVILISWRLFFFEEASAEVGRWVVSRWPRERFRLLLVIRWRRSSGSPKFGLRFE